MTTTTIESKKSHITFICADGSKFILKPGRSCRVWVKDGKFIRVKGSPRSHR